MKEIFVPKAIFNKLYMLCYSEEISLYELVLCAYLQNFGCKDCIKGKNGYNKRNAIII